MSPEESPSGQAPDRSSRWLLNDEREFLSRSLDDAEREHDAGDLSDGDYQVLVARDRRRLAAVEAELAALGPAAGGEVAGTDDVVADHVAPDHDVVPPASPRRSRRSEWRRVGVIASCALIVAGAVLLVGHALQSAAPGQPVTGGITGSKQQVIEQQLAEANTFNNEGQDLAALQVLEKVLMEDPSDPEALADAGWLQWNTGYRDRSASVEAAGLADVHKAVRVAPSYYKGHFYLALILYFGDGDDRAAATQFGRFLADDPPESVVALVAAAIRDSYAKAGLRVPASLPTTTTTVPRSSTSTTTTSIP
jgi:tetratricopeptide (TPR) repeat protein